MRIFDMLRKRVETSGIERKILVMCRKEIYGDFCNAEFLEISETEYQELVQLYFTYEFTDRIQLVGGSTQYGTLFHYVQTGILTEEELVEALLC